MFARNICGNILQETCVIFLSFENDSSTIKTQPNYFLKRNSLKRGQYISRLLFSMVVLFSIAYNVYQLASSQKSPVFILSYYEMSLSTLILFVVLLNSRSTILLDVIFCVFLFAGTFETYNFSQFRNWLTIFKSFSCS